MAETDGGIKGAFAIADRSLRHLLIAADDVFARIPRKYVETAGMAVFACLVSYLAIKDMKYAFALVVAMIAMVILVRRPIIMVYSLVLIIPVAWINLLGDRLRVITFLTVIALGFFASQAIVRRNRLKFETLYFPFIAYVLFCFLSLFNSIDVSFSLIGMKYYVISLLFGLTAILAVKEKQHLVMIIWILIGWGVLEGILSLAQSIISAKFFPAYYFNVFSMDIVQSYSVGSIRRASGTFESGPRLAMFLLLPLAMSLVFFFRNIFDRRTMWGVILSVIALGLFVSFTRIGVILGASYIFLFYFYERDKQRIWRTTFTVVLIAGVLFTLIQFLIPHEVTGAMGERFTQEGDQVYLDRFYFLYNAIMAFTEHPLIGWGMRTYTLHSWDFMQQYPVPWRSLTWDVASLAMPQNVPVHNDYGRMLAETGIFSLIACIAMYVVTFKNLAWVIRRTKDAFYEAAAIGFTLFLSVMIVYWFFHEYIMEEPFVSVMPFAFSIVLKNLVHAEDVGPPEEAVSLIGLAD